MILQQEIEKEDKNIVCPRVSLTAANSERLKKKWWAYDPAGDNGTFKLEQSKEIWYHILLQ